MKKRFLTFCLPILLLVFLIVYTSIMRPNMYERLVQEDVRSEDINQDDYCEEVEYSEESQEDMWYLSFPAYASAEEVNDALHYGDPPLFILHDGYFYHLKSAEMSSRIHSNETPVVDALNLQQEELPVLNLAEGDQRIRSRKNTRFRRVYSNQVVFRLARNNADSGRAVKSGF